MSDVTLDQLAEQAARVSSDGCYGGYDQTCSDREQPLPVAQWCNQCLIGALADATQQVARFVPDGAHINALPEPLRRWVHDLETRSDPAGDLRALRLAEDENRMLRAKLATHVWECGCGAINGVNLADCAACTRPRSEGGYR